MAKTGAQKLYNTAREGNGPMLLFMLSCPDTLSPFSTDKLKEAINTGKDPTCCWLNIAKAGGLAIATSARQQLETKLMGNEDMHTPEGAAGLEKVLSLYEGEMYSVVPWNWAGIMHFALAQPTDEPILRALRMSNRHQEYSTSTEDDVLNQTNVEYADADWQRPDKVIDRARAAHLSKLVIDFGTNDAGFIDTYPNVPLNFVNRGFPQMASYLFDQRLGCDIMDERQRKIFNVLSPAAKERIISGASIPAPEPEED